MRLFECFSNTVAFKKGEHMRVCIKCISFILAGILYRKFMFFFALRKKLLRSGKVLKTHATPTPALFIQKTPQKCQEKNLPRERNTHFLFSRERNTHFLFPRERNTHFPSLGKFFSREIHFLTLYSVFLFGLFLAFEGCKTFTCCRNSI